MKLWNRCQFFPNWNSEFPVDFSRLTKNYRLEKLMVIFSPKSKQLFWTYQKNTLPAFMIIQSYMTWHFPFFDSFSQVVFSSMQIKQLFCVSKGILATGGEVERACNKHKQSNSKSVINFNEFDEPWQILSWSSLSLVISKFEGRSKSILHLRRVFIGKSCDIFSASLPIRNWSFVTLHLGKPLRFSLELDQWSIRPSEKMSFLKLVLASPKFLFWCSMTCSVN